MRDCSANPNEATEMRFVFIWTLLFWLVIVPALLFLK
jgi:hypothetical protein